MIQSEANEIEWLFQTLGEKQDELIEALELSSKTHLKDKDRKYLEDSEKRLKEV